LRKCGRVRDWWKNTGQKERLEDLSKDSKRALKKVLGKDLNRDWKKVGLKWPKTLLPA
jgi:hypothetical protein